MMERYFYTSWGLVGGGHNILFLQPAEKRYFPLKHGSCMHRLGEIASKENIRGNLKARPSVCKVGTSSKVPYVTS